MKLTKRKLKQLQGLNVPEGVYKDFVSQARELHATAKGAKQKKPPGRSYSAWRNEVYADGYIDSSRRHQGPNILPVAGLYVNTNPTLEDLEACPF